MTQATARIPVVWETTPAVADRLLGRSGRPLLEQTLSLAKNLAVERKWPLVKIRVELYQDPEIAWEYLLLVLVLDCDPRKAEMLWDEYLDATKLIEQQLNEQELDIFIKMIDYEFECNP